MKRFDTRRRVLLSAMAGVSLTAVAAPRESRAAGSLLPPLLPDLLRFSPAPAPTPPLPRPRAPGPMDTRQGPATPLEMPSGPPPPPPAPLPTAWRVTIDDPSPGLMRFLRRYHARALYPDLSPTAPDHKATVRVATVRLGDRRTVLYAALVNGEHCNPKGYCPMATVVSRDGGRHFRGLGFTWIVDLPLRVLPTTHHGLPDLGVRAPCHAPACSTEVVLSFNGRRYPENSTVAPARELPLGVEEGQAMIPDPYVTPANHEISLFP